MAVVGLEITERRGMWAARLSHELVAHLPDPPHTDTADHTNILPGCMPLTPPSEGKFEANEEPVLQISHGAATSDCTGGT